MMGPVTLEAVRRGIEVAESGSVPADRLPVRLHQLKAIREMFSRKETSDAKAPA